MTAALRSSLARAIGDSPTPPAQIDAMRRAAWIQRGVLVAAKNDPRLDDLDRAWLTHIADKLTRPMTPAQRGAAWVDEATPREPGQRRALAPDERARREAVMSAEAMFAQGGNA